MTMQEVAYDITTCTCRLNYMQQTCGIFDNFHCPNNKTHLHQILRKQSTTAQSKKTEKTLYKF